MDIINTMMNTGTQIPMIILVESCPGRAFKINKTELRFVPCTVQNIKTYFFLKSIICKIHIIE